MIANLHVKYQYLRVYIRVHTYIIYLLIVGNERVVYIIDNINYIGTRHVLNSKIDFQTYVYDRYYIIEVYYMLIR